MLNKMIYLYIFNNIYITIDNILMYVIVYHVKS